MHFRHLLISGLFVGAAMFLPDNVLAAQNDLGGPKNAPAAAQQVIPAVEMEQDVVKPVVADKERTISLPDPALNNQGERKPQPTEVPSNHSAVQTPAAAPQPQKQAAAPQKPAVASQKPPAASHNLPEQAKGNVQSGENKSVKSIKVHDPEKGTPAQKQKNEAGQKTPASKNEVRSSALDTFHIAGMEKKNKIQFAKFELLELQKENFNLTSAAIPKNDSITPMEKPPLKQGDMPSGREEIPKASQVPSPSQRTSSHGGQSNDRTNPGLNSVYFPDKWFVWNRYYEIQLVQSYQSRQIGLNNQWVNAPPSPPPQKAPLLETVTCS